MPRLLRRPRDLVERRELEGRARRRAARPTRARLAPEIDRPGESLARRRQRGQGGARTHLLQLAQDPRAAEELRGSSRLVGIEERALEGLELERDDNGGRSAGERDLGAGERDLGIDGLGVGPVSVVESLLRGGRVASRQLGAGEERDGPRPERRLNARLDESGRGRAGASGVLELEAGAHGDEASLEREGIGSAHELGGLAGESRLAQPQKSARAVESSDPRRRARLGAREERAGDGLVGDPRRERGRERRLAVGLVRKQLGVGVGRGELALGRGEILAGRESGAGLGSRALLGSARRERRRLGAQERGDESDARPRSLGSRSGQGRGGELADRALEGLERLRAVGRAARLHRGARRLLGDLESVLVKEPRRARADEGDRQADRSQDEREMRARPGGAGRACGQGRSERTRPPSASRRAGSGRGRRGARRRRDSAGPDPWRARGGRSRREPAGSLR